MNSQKFSTLRVKKQQDLYILVMCHLNSRLKNKLQYGQPLQPETPALTKIQHLEDLVCDLESSESKLRRQLQESQRNEHDLQAKLAQAQTSDGEKTTGKLSWEEKERQFTQEQQLRELKAKIADLEEEVQVLRKDDNLDKLAKVTRHSLVSCSSNISYKKTLYYLTMIKLIP